MKNFKSSRTLTSKRRGNLNLEEIDEIKPGNKMFAPEVRLSQQSHVRIRTRTFLLVPLG